jgi:malonyl-CoA O-methyltransferase
MAWIRRLGHRKRLPVVDPRPGYDLWAATYDADEPDNPVLRAERTAVEARLPSLKGRAVLDVACGTGYYALQAAREGARLAVGVDLSAGMLRQARRRATCDDLPVALVQADQSRLPLARANFDVAIHALGAGYTSDLRPAAELGRVLRPNGMAFVSELHPQGIRRGWRRTFSCREGGMRHQVAVRSYPHPIEGFRTAFERAGLSVTAVIEPRIDETLQPLFAAADALARYQQVQGLALLVVFELRRSSYRQFSRESHAN